jgi:hypothetical protein
MGDESSQTNDSLMSQSSSIGGSEASQAAPILGSYLGIKSSSAQSLPQFLADVGIAPPSSSSTKSTTASSQRRLHTVIDDDDNNARASVGVSARIAATTNSDSKRSDARPRPPHNDDNNDDATPETIPPDDYVSSSRAAAAANEDDDRITSMDDRRDDDNNDNDSKPADNTSSSKDDSITSNGGKKRKATDDTTKATSVVSAKAKSRGRPKTGKNVVIKEKEQPIGQLKVGGFFGKRSDREADEAMLAKVAAAGVPAKKPSTNNKKAARLDLDALPPLDADPDDQHRLPRARVKR